MHRTARAWVELMERLGYQRFAAVGGDWGSAVTTSLALQRPESSPGSTWLVRWWPLIATRSAT